jgi:hypothetical protein
MDDLKEKPVIVFDPLPNWCPWYVRYVKDDGSAGFYDLEGVETLTRAREAAAEAGFDSCGFHRIPTP